MRRRCWIAGAGEWCGEGWAPRPGDMIVAADGGQASLARMGVAPDVVVGDFDSLDAPPDGPEVVRLSREKDDTDMLAAVRLGMERGCADFRIYGGAGGRIDHTIANLQTLNFLARRGLRGVLVEKMYKLTSIACGEVRFRAGSRGMLSIFAQCGQARGVDLEGLAYARRDLCLGEDYPVGVSNEFLPDTPARVAVREGVLLVAWEHSALAEDM